MTGEGGAVSSCHELGLLPLPACNRTRVLPEFGHYSLLWGRSRMYPTSAERVGVRGTLDRLGSWRVPLTRLAALAARRPLPASAGRGGAAGSRGRHSREIRWWVER